MQSTAYKISISYNFCRYSGLIASVGFTIDRVTTQHTPKCVENSSDSKISYIYLPKFSRFPATSFITGYRFWSSYESYMNQIC